MFDKALTKGLLAAIVVVLVAGVAQADVYLPGLHVRAWQGVTPYLVVEGNMFDLANPNPAPNDSTFLSTIGFMTDAIHVEGLDNAEWFLKGGSTSPQPKGYTDMFAVEYRGLLLVPSSGTYRFATTSDDGSALWVSDGPLPSNPRYDDAAVKNNDAHGMLQKSSDPISLTAGYHDFIVRCNQGGGADGLYVQWETPGSTDFADIPGSQLFHEGVPEPGTLTLLGVGAVGLLAYAWRRRRRLA